MDAIAQRNEKLANLVANNLKTRHFDAYVVNDEHEARELALSLIPNDHTVGWGGSVTIDQIGLKNSLKERGNTVIDRESAQTPAERVKMMKDALTCNTFLMSANAVSQDGVLVNIDGNGNRVAALIYGPESVVVVVGINKIAPDVQSALMRARNLAAPTNSQRFNINTPCKINGACANCKCPDSICAQINFTRLCKPQGRIKVIIVTKELGF